MTPGSAKSRSSSTDPAQLANSRSVDFLRETDQKHRTDGLLAGSVSISKQQPSWDPFNAAPIEEEEGYFDSHIQNPGYYDTESLLSPENGSILGEAGHQSTVSDQSGGGVEAQDHTKINEPNEDRVAQSHTDFFGGWWDSPDMPRNLMLLEEEDKERVEIARQGQAVLNRGHERSAPVAGVQGPNGVPTQSTSKALEPGVANEGEADDDVSEQQGLEEQPYDAITVAGPVASGHVSGVGELESVPETHSENAQGQDSRVLQDKTRTLPLQHTRTVSDPPMMYSDALRSSAEYVRNDIVYTPGVADKKRKGPELVQHPASFGLPPVRRNSAFGFVFRSKSKKRFPIDDDAEDEHKENHTATYVPDGHDWEPVVWGGDRPRNGNQVDESAHKQALKESSDEPRTPVFKTAALDRSHISPRTSDDGGPVELPGSEPSRNIQPSGRRGSATSGVGADETFDKDRKQHSSTPLLFDRGLFGRSTGKASADQLHIPSHHPPSSAQRFPGLFHPKASEELSANLELPHNYPAPLTRNEAMLPRQQGTEYMLPGVGPPEGLNRHLTRSRRSSSFIRGIGGRLSRNTSRDRSSRAPSTDRSGLASRDSSKPMQMNAQSAQNAEQYEGSRPPTPTLETYRSRRRSSLSLLNVLSRTNTSTPDPTSQQNNISQSNYHDMSKEEHKAIITAQEGRNKLNKTARQSAPPTPSMHIVESHTEIKKKRFSGLTTFLSRRGSNHRPRLNSNGLSIQRGPVSEAGSPVLPATQLVQKPQKESKHHRTLTKPPPMGENRSRRNSTTYGLSPVESEALNRIQQSHPPFRHGSVSNGGNYVVKGEPLYEATPIPQAYDLVHGEGNIVSPTTYDPRGFNVQRRQSLQTWQQGGNGNSYPPPRPRAQYFDPNVYDPLSIAHGSPAENPYGMAGGGAGYEYFEQNPSPPRRQNSYHVPLFRHQDCNMIGGAGETYDELQKNERSFSRLSGRSLSNRSVSARSYNGSRESYEMPGPHNRRLSPSPAQVGMALSESYQPQNQQPYAPSDNAMGSPPRRRDNYEMPADRMSGAGLSPPRAELSGLPSLREHVVTQLPPRMGMAMPMGQVPRQQVGFQGYVAWERSVHGMSAGHGVGPPLSDRSM